MKKIRVEVESTLTYKPFENIYELLKESPKKTKKGEKKDGHRGV